MHEKKKKKLKQEYSHGLPSFQCDQKQVCQTIGVSVTENLASNDTFILEQPICLIPYRTQSKLYWSWVIYPLITIMLDLVKYPLAIEIDGC